MEKKKTKNNMELWNKVSVTNPAHTKKVGFGANLTSVCAQQQIKMATMQFGPMGSDWGVRGEEFNIIEKWLCIYYKATLYYPGGEIEIHSDIQIAPKTKNKPEGKYNEDWSKKLATDALTKGLSKLGFNSDIFEGKFDDNKYVEDATNFFNNQNGGQS